MIMNASFLQVLQDEGTQVVDLCAGRIKDGRDFYAFIQMDIASYRDYQKALGEGKPIDLNAYGKILHAGWGKEPDDAISAWVMDTYTQNAKILQAMGRDAASIADILHQNSKRDDAR